MTRVGSIWCQPSGSIVRFEGNIPPDLDPLLRNAGAFPREGAWWATRAQWEAIRRLLGVMGIAVAEGPAPETIHQAQFEISSLGEVIVYGPLPKDVPPEYLGVTRAKGYMGMTPLALDKAAETFKASKIEPVFTPQVQLLREKLVEMRKAVQWAKTMPHEELPNVEFADKRFFLLPYQRRALAMFDATDGRYLLGDEPGLGKTIMGLGMARHSGAERVLVVCPANAEYVWHDHAKDWDGSKPLVLKGRSGGWRQPKGEREWVILNPSILGDRLKEIQEWNPDLVLGDEFHYFKGDSQRTKNMRLLTRPAPYCVGMTGTPITNLVIDLWSQLDILWPRRWGDRFTFGIAFAGGEKKHWGWSFTGKSREDVLNEYLEPIMLRRLKKEVGQDLPPKFRTPVRVDLVPAIRGQYDRELEKLKGMKDELRKARLRGKEDTALSGQVLARANRLRQISSLGRIGPTVERIMDKLEDGKPVVVFTFFLESLEGIKAALTAKEIKFAVIDGSTPPEKRGQIANDFQAGKYQVFLGQIEAAGTAITLTKADRMILHDISLTPLNNVQAEDRINRLGASGDRTVHEYLVGRDTVDEKLLKVMMVRIANSSDFLDLGKGVETDFVNEVLESFGG